MVLIEYARFGTKAQQSFAQPDEVVLSFFRDHGAHWMLLSKGPNKFQDMCTFDDSLETVQWLVEDNFNLIRCFGDKGDITNIEIIRPNNA